MFFILNKITSEKYSWKLPSQPFGLDQSVVSVLTILWKALSYDWAASRGGKDWLLFDILVHQVHLLPFGGLAVIFLKKINKTKNVCHIT